MVKIPQHIIRITIIVSLLSTGACSMISGTGRSEIDNLPGSVSYSDFTSTVPELYHAAHDYLGKGDFSEAEALYRQIIATEPDSPHGYIGLGASLFYQDRLAEAQDAYETAIGLSSENPMAYIGLGSAAYSQGNFQTAQEAYATALELDEMNADAHLGMGLVLIELEQCDAAIAYLERFLELAPNTQQRDSVRASITICENH